MRVHGLLFVSLCFFSICGTVTASRKPLGGNAIVKKDAARSSICGATHIRLNIVMNKLYGKWFPIETSDDGYHLWASSLYGREEDAPRSFCPVWEFKRSLTVVPGMRYPTMKVKVAHEKTKVEIEAILIADRTHPGKSKWLMSWPKEDALTSIIAVGFNGDNTKRYDWLLTMDCDIKGLEAPDWAIFSRNSSMNPETLQALKAVIDGIEGVSPENGKVFAKPCKKLEEKLAYHKGDRKSGDEDED